MYNIYASIYDFIGLWHTQALCGGIGFSLSWVLFGTCRLDFRALTTAALLLSQCSALVSAWGWFVAFCLLGICTWFSLPLTFAQCLWFHLLLHLTLRPWDEGTTDFPGTCMSEAAINRLTQAVEKLTLATESLTVALQSVTISSDIEPLQAAPVVELTQPTSSTATRDSQYVIVVEELSRLPYPLHFVEETSRHTLRGVEDGPPSVPAYVYRHFEERLTSKPPGTSARAISAYNAGFWAKAAIDCCIPYQPRELHPQHVSRHWVVLRSSFGSTFRVTSKKDLRIICRTDDPLLVCETFESLVEVEAFCLGSLFSIPALRGCSKANWGS